MPFKAKYWVGQKFLWVFQLWIGWRLELGELGFRVEREGDRVWLRAGRMVLESALPGAENFFLFYYFLLLLFARIQFGFYYKIDQKHIFWGKKKGQRQL